MLHIGDAESRRHDVLGRRPLAAEQLHQGAAVSRVVDRLAHEQVVKRGLTRVHLEVRDVVARVDVNLARAGRLQLGQAVGRDCAEVPVECALRDLVDGRLGIHADLDHDPLQMAGGDVWAPGVKARVSNQSDVVLRYILGDHVRAGRNPPLRNCGDVAVGRALGESERERDRHVLEERAIRLGQMEGDSASSVVSDDPADAALAGLRVAVGADDAAVEADAAGIDAEQPLDRELDVGGEDLAIDRRGELDTAAHVERVGAAGVRDLRHRDSEIGDDHRGSGGRLEDLPPLGRVREPAVEVVRVVGDRGAKRAAVDRARAGARVGCRGRGAAATARAQRHRDRSDRDENEQSTDRHLESHSAGNNSK